MKNVVPKEIIDGVAVMCSYDKLMNIADIKPNSQKTKQHNDNHLELLSRTIKSEGWRAPIVVSRQNGFILDGHCRFMAAQKMGAQFIPVQYQDCEDVVQTIDLADTNEDMIRDLIQEIKIGAFDINLD
jgi:ParB-like chromosome segregation protein Spo0J